MIWTEAVRRVKNFTSNSQICSLHHAHIAQRSDKRNANGNLYSFAADDNMSRNSIASPTSPKDSRKHDQSDQTVPKLDLNSPKEKEKAIQEKAKNSARIRTSQKDDIKNKAAEKKDENRKASATKPKQLSSDIRSKTQTLIVSKIPVRNNISVNKSEDLNNTVPLVRTSLDKSAKDIYKSKMLNNLNEKRKLENGKEKTDTDILNQAVQRQKSKTALEYEKKIRSSGYGNPVNPRLRPLALKPKSATVSSTVPKLRRDSSAKSTKSSILVSREDSRPFAETKNSGKWELVPTTIKEETSKNEVFNGNKSLEDEDPTPGNSPRKTGRSDDITRELAKIHEISREETTHSDLLSQTELQIRLSSIKKKVEVRKRGRDSRSSVGSELDSSFQDRYN